MPKDIGREMLGNTADGHSDYSGERTMVERCDSM
jgi:hypothetical protein